MKKSIFTTTLFFCSMLIVSCSDSGNSASQQNKVNPANTAKATQVNSESISANQVKLDNSKKTIKSASSEKTSPKNNQSKEIKNNNPTSGIIKDMQNGDLKCYVTIVDEKGKVYEGVGAVFEVCEPEKYVNKKVKMSYSLENVSDCQSSEPCGKTIKEWLISKIEIQKQ
ncbi:MAG: hypothetical protein RM022_016315 [Nostoc sp. EfeVER01]|uniref:hypothetical protein n=1 Tax=unclassified Nostoc TaxID=2593658 RepID=UPI002AD448A6|nr:MULTISPECIES: hypothetical protein [unclassified Nostoc]MDZ7945958.1 hypothetical protein [Nostoc sp. EfeVER01]MDZ7990721.1 hypothetical protein [Nostoc sp. EspVER01]